MSEQLRELHAAYRANVDLLASSRHYQQPKRAAEYVETRFGPLWRIVLPESEHATIIEQLKLTPAMVLLIHLFGKGVLGYGRGRSSAPLMMHWCGIGDGDADHVRMPRAIAKPDIARITGLNTRMVNDAIARFRGNQIRFMRYGILCERRLAYPLFVRTGIMLDLMTSLQLAFSFLHEEYTSAARAAEDARLNDAPTNFKQQVWCQEALSTSTLPQEAVASSASWSSCSGAASTNEAPR